MPMAASFTRGTQRMSAFDRDTHRADVASDGMATFAITCGNCGLGVSANIVHQESNNGVLYWLRCPHCTDASVRTRSGAVYPIAPAGGTVLHLPNDVERAWREARTSHAVAAYTASEVMCRKILMHLAVDVAGSKP